MVERARREKEKGKRVIMRIGRYGWKGWNSGERKNG